MLTRMVRRLQQDSEEREQKARSDALEARLRRAVKQ